MLSDNPKLREITYKNERNLVQSKTIPDIIKNFIFHIKFLSESFLNDELSLNDQFFIGECIQVTYDYGNWHLDPNPFENFKSQLKIKKIQNLKKNSTKIS